MSRICDNATGNAAMSRVSISKTFAYLIGATITMSLAVVFLAPQSETLIFLLWLCASLCLTAFMLLMPYPSETEWKKLSIYPRSLFLRRMPNLYAQQFGFWSVFVCNLLTTVLILKNLGIGPIGPESLPPVLWAASFFACFFCALDLYRFYRLVLVSGRSDI